MPVKKRYAKRPRRKRKKRRSYNAPAVSVVRNVFGMPDLLSTRLRLNQRFTLTGTSGVVDTDVWRGNSLYDPYNPAAASPQPQFFDQLSAIYNRYRVVGSSVKVTFVNDDDVAIEAVVYPSISATPVTLIEDARSQSRARSGIVGGKGSNQFKILKTYSSTAQTRGVSQTAVKTDDDYTAAINTNPTRTWYWVVFGQAMDQASTWTLDCNIEMIFYCTMEKKNNVDQS